MAAGRAARTLQDDLRAHPVIVVPVLPNSRVRRFALLAVALTVIYHSNLRPIPSGDTAPAALLPFSVVLDHQVTFDRFAPWIEQHREVQYAFTRHAGHWYSRYPIAGPLLVAPFYVPAILVHRLQGASPATLFLIARITEKFTATFLTVAAMLVLLLLLERMLNRSAAFWLTAAIGLGTEMWSTSSQALWQHSFGVLAIVAWMYAVDRFSEADSGARWQWITGAAAGVALAVRPVNAVLLVATVAALLVERAKVGVWIRALLPPALAGGIVAAYNWEIFGRLAGGYYSSFTGNFWTGMAGVFVSPGRGLLIYTPMAAFAVCAFLPAARKARAAHKPLLVASCTMAILLIATVAAWSMWWGGHCFGPRLLTELIPALAVLLALGWQSMRGLGRWAFTAAVAASILVQAAGVYSYPQGTWDVTPVDVDAAPTRLWDFRDNPLTRAAGAGLSTRPYAALKVVLEHGPATAARQIGAWQASSPSH
jgi:hypothetical protein